MSHTHSWHFAIWLSIPPSLKTQNCVKPRNYSLLLFLLFPWLNALAEPDKLMERQIPLAAPFYTEEGASTFLISLPAPRGLIVDRNGEPLASSKTVRRAAILMDQFQIGQESEASIAQATLATIEAFPYQDSLLPVPDEEAILKHWRNRRQLPLLITEPLSDTQATKFEKILPFEPTFKLITEYQRQYPQKAMASHVIGYVSREVLRPAGPFLPEEPYWPRVYGRDGVEKVLELELAGEDGLLNIVSDAGGHQEEYLVRRPKPGKTLVMSIDSKMQRLAEKILARNRRPGAFVVVDSLNGDVLVLASYPTFDLSQFVPSISAKKFAEIRDSPGEPFFPRAHGARYPPGSTFKPIVALAAMHQGDLTRKSLLYCGPSMRIAGRTFKNWNTHEKGNYNVRQALMRSSNTWFYQAGLKTGGRNILNHARRFGLGEKPLIPLDGVTSGYVPKNIVAQRAIANLSIGQGTTLVSPLQAALAMAGVANGGYVPKPRLVIQYQDPPPSDKVTRVTPVLRPHVLDYNEKDIEAVQQGMYAVVNDKYGTGKSAGMAWPPVCGKTGTAEWTSNGENRYLAWFSGFVDAHSPRLAFAVMCEGKRGETIYGGRVAAPMAGEFLRTIYGNEATYRVTAGKRPAELPTIDWDPVETPVASILPP